MIQNNCLWLNCLIFYFRNVQKVNVLSDFRKMDKVATIHITYTAAHC